MEIVKNPNRLIHETSPYLLQHANNPVDWYPWGEEAFEKARAEDKLVLISIGYSSCHWCHVMERESFEDAKIASLMNENFICIKVDREERPDVDHVYMDAVQLMTGTGGWPLNCFALPDKRPVYGGTYFPPKNWQSILFKLKTLYKDDRDQILKQADQIYEGISLTGIAETFADEKSDYKEIIDKFYPKIKHGFDSVEGGFKGAPKFPTPVIWNMLLNYYQYAGDKSISDQLILTLDKMANGGIFDHLGGGFARYSTDSHWIVPHFEKMLYDNAQLISLYSRTYFLSGKKLYRNIIEKTVSFIQRELSYPKGGYYSSYDADTVGGEGEFYVWTKEEIDRILKDKSKFFCDLYNVTHEGNWEGKNILFMRSFDSLKLSEEDEVELERLKKILFKEREKRIKPPVDDKVILSWNALTISGFVHAYNVTDNFDYLKAATKLANYILENMVTDEVHLFRICNKNGEKKIDAFLDDYAFLIKALIDLYHSTLDEGWLKMAKQFTDYVILHFYDEKDKLFFYTSDLFSDLPVRKKEVQDSVIPSSNSVMAENLFFLSGYYNSGIYNKMCRRMIARLCENMKRFPRYFSNWINLALYMQQKQVEVVIMGEKSLEFRKELFPFLKPHYVLAGSPVESKIPVLEHRFVPDKTLIYICTDKVCSLPLNNTKEAIELLKNIPSE